MPRWSHRGLPPGNKEEDNDSTQVAVIVNDGIGGKVEVDSECNSDGNSNGNGKGDYCNGTNKEEQEEEMMEEAEEAEEEGWQRSSKKCKI